MSLKKHAITGVKWTTLSMIIVTVTQIIQLSILARYLTPRDFGLMAMVMVVTGFAQAFMDMGISNAIIFKQKVTHLQLSSLYWLNIGSGTTLFLVTMIIAHPISMFYNEAKLAELLTWISATFLISAFGNQYRIMLQKELRFHILSIIEIVAALGTFGISVALAMAGYGVYSLVFGFLSGSLISNFLTVAVGIKQHRPSLVYDHGVIKEFINFGLFQMGEKTITYFNGQFDVLLIGKLLGSEILGIYSIAKNLSMKPAAILNPVITKVAFPIMAKVQHDDRHLKSIYLRTINYLSSLNFPIYLAIVIFAKPIIMLLAGEKWHEAVPVLQILSLYFLVRSTGNPVGTLLLAKGRADLGFLWNVALFIITPLAILLGSKFNLTGIVVSLLILQVGLIWPNWFFLVKKLCGARFWEYYRELLLPFAISLATAAAMTLASSFFQSDLTKIAAGAVIGLPVYFFSNYRFNADFMNVLINFVVRDAKPLPT